MSGIGTFTDPKRASEACKLWGDGLSCTVIGNRMGTSRNAVMGRIYRLRRQFCRANSFEAFAERLAGGQQPSGLAEEYGLAELRRMLGEQAR